MKEKEMDFNSFPLCPKESIDKIDDYFRSIREWFPFPSEDFQKWKVLKKAVPIDILGELRIASDQAPNRI